MNVKKYSAILAHVNVYIVFSSFKKHSKKWLKQLLRNNVIIYMYKYVFICIYLHLEVYFIYINDIVTLSFGLYRPGLFLWYGFLGLRSTQRLLLLLRISSCSVR